MQDIDYKGASAYFREDRHIYSIKPIGHLVFTDNATQPCAKQENEYPWEKWEVVIAYKSLMRPAKNPKQPGFYSDILSRPSGNCSEDNTNNRKP